jgi:predicted nucleic acid-binding protein
MSLVIDANIVIACVMNEPDRDLLLKATSDVHLIAPASLPWEIGNALSRC